MSADARPALTDADGFVDTGDMVEQRGDRLYFVGRRSGIINVGGLKVHPEEVEAVINRHAGVRMSLVKARANPITGAIVVADVVPRGAVPAESMASSQAALKAEILRSLPRHPAAPQGAGAGPLRREPRRDPRRQAGAPSCVTSS